MIKKIGITIVSIILVLIVISLVYLSTGQNKAYAEDVEYLKQNSTYENGYYKVDHDSEDGFIFYPGAKVPPEAYTYLSDIENANIYIVDFPFNFAFFKPNIAGEIIENEEEVSDWYIGGHSLGGVFAYNFAKNNPELVKGIVFLASYPTAKIPEDSPLKVLTIYGTSDGVVGDYKEKLELFNKSSNIVKIDGANHTQFGNYDLQKGDNKSNISPEEQHKIIVQNISDFMN